MDWWRRGEPEPRRLGLLGGSRRAGHPADVLEEWDGGLLVVIIGGLGAEEPDHRHRRLLRPRHHRTRRRAPNPRDERAAFHWITSSAVANSLSGMARPRLWRS